MNIHHNILKVTAAAAAVMFLTGCFETIEFTAEDTTQTDSTTAVSFSEEIVTETVSETSAASEEVSSSDPVPEETAADISEIPSETELSVSQQTPAIRENSCEHLLSIFKDADSSTGFIGKNMKEVLAGVNKDVPIKKLTPNNVKKAVKDGISDKVLFAFSINRSNGFVPVVENGVTYYASGFTSDSGDNYTALFGNSIFSDPHEAAKYINTCGRADYIAFCAETSGGAVLMPIAAGTSRDGIYAVIPTAEMMGYDMSSAEPFAGISDSFNIYITASYFDSKNERLYLMYDTESSFTDDIAFVCDGVYINGAHIPEEYSNDFPFYLNEKGTLQLNTPEPPENAVFYFSGTLFRANDDEEEKICSVGITAFPTVK